MAASHCPSELLKILVIGGSLGGNASSSSVRQGVKAWTSSKLPTSTTCNTKTKVNELGIVTIQVNPTRTEAVVKIHSIFAITFSPP